MNSERKTFKNAIPPKLDYRAYSNVIDANIAIRSLGKSTNDTKHTGFVNLAVTVFIHCPHRDIFTATFLYEEDMLTELLESGELIADIEDAYIQSELFVKDGLHVRTH